MEKMRIAVFDFNAEDCAHTAGAIRELLGQEAQVTGYTDMREFVYAFGEGRDSPAPFAMAFVGVDDMMGVETARNIREMDEGCPLFLVSRVSDYGLEGFRLRALDYLTKPVSPQRIERAVRRAEAWPEPSLGSRNGNT